VTIHIGAEPGQIAKTVLMPGDPMRAKHFAETFLDDPVCFNRVRGMLGFTGTYQGKRVSVMGSGMGIPSLSIYATELIKDYGVTTLMRVGTCGAFQPDLEIGDVILAMSASTDSQVNKLRFKGRDFAPTANFELLLGAYQAAQKLGVKVQVGPILSGDSFYGGDPAMWKLWASYGILAVEMEAAGLYTIAANYGVRALAIVTVSDSAATHKAASSEEREKSYTTMAEIALAVAE